MSGSRPQGGSRRFAFREAGLAACAGLVLAVTGCASARQVEIPQGADAEIVCSAWLDSFMGDPSSAPLALGARIVFVGVGDSRDPRRIVPEAMSVSGDPSFEVAEVVDGRFMHCQGAYRLEQVESEGALWSKAFFVAVDLVWDGERFRASEATIVLDSYRDEASQTMFERALASQAPYEGAFSGDGPERFYAIDSVYSGIPPGIDPAVGAVLSATYTEILILGADGHLDYHETLFVDRQVEKSGAVDELLPTGTFSRGKRNVTVQAMDLGLDRTAVRFEWEESEDFKVPSKEKKGETCVQSETTRTTSIRIMRKGKFKEIFGAVTARWRTCGCDEGCEKGGSGFEGFTTKLTAHKTGDGPSRLHLVFSYEGGRDWLEVYAFVKKRYELVK